MNARSSLVFSLLLTMMACGGSTPPAAAPPLALKAGIDQYLFDKSVRPQDDFFRYVNGTWLAKTEIPADKPMYGSFVQLADKSEADLRAIVEESANAANKAAGSVSQQVGDFYNAFMNDARAEQLGAVPVKATLDRIAAIKTPEDFAREAAELSVIGVTGPVGGYITSDAKDPTTNIVYLVQAGIALPDRDYYLKDDAKFAETRTKYQTYLETVFTLAGRSTAVADAKSVLALETSLARIQWDQVASRDAIKTYNKVALAKMPVEMPGFDWMTFAKMQGIDKSTDVIVNQPSFFKSFAAMVPTTPIGTWKVWLSAQYLTASAPYLSKPFVDAYFEFFGRTLNGQQEQRPRWKRGVGLINNNMGEAVGKLYVERHFPPAAKVRMQKMIANLIDAYKQSISTLDWMTPATRQAALAKLAKFTTKIAYPDKWRDYTGLDIKADDLLGDVERAQKFENDFQVAKLGKPVDRGEWLMTPQTINAYYNPLNNEIVFPAAILQPPFFDFEADDAVNYGGIGAVIGHEIGHGFDDQGRHYDGDGALRDWWTPADAAEFEKRAKALAAQFDQYNPIDTMHVNGNLTLGENIGDLGGLSIAHKAYVISLGGKPAPTIDGLTGDQRFFMGWGQVWRSKMRDEYLRQILVSNPHAPGEYRVNGPVSNVSEFYDAFGVKPGDKLYREPDKRVRIW